MCGRLRWILHKGRQAGCKINQKLLGMRSVAETGGALALTTAADFVASSFFTPPFFWRSRSWSALITHRSSERTIHTESAHGSCSFSFHSFTEFFQNSLDAFRSDASARSFTSSFWRLSSSSLL